jgi:RND superfamily putative drug exporter
MAFIAAWIVVLLGVGGAAALFKGPFVNSFALPKSESYQTLQNLKTALPSAAGGRGQIALISQSPFTAEQQAAVKDVIAELKTKNHVESVQDPFASQQQLDDGAKKIADFPQQQKDGQAKIDAGRKQLKDSQAKIDAGRKQLAPVLAQIAQLKAAGQTAQATAAEAQIAPTVKQLDAGQAQADSAKKQLDAAQKKLDDAAAQVASGKKQLDSTKGLRFVSEDGKVATVAVGFDEASESVPLSDLDAIKNTAKTLESKGIQVELSKELNSQTPSLAGPAEIIGVAIAAILLFIMLGTLVAAGLPLLTAVIGVAMGLGITMALSSVFEFSSLSLSLGGMLGLAVGIDYSLFIVNRYRVNRARGDDKVEAIALAVGTAGNAVTFAGLTVIIALAALTISGIPFLGVMGLVGAGTIAAAVLVALTLTPALLSAIGPLAMPKRLREISAKSAAAREQGGELPDHEPAKRRWGRIVTRYPWVTVAACIAILGAIALPATNMRLALPDGGQELSDSTQYKAYKAIGKAFGEGTNGPLVIVTDLPKGLTQAQAEDLQYKVADTIRSMPDVTAAVPGGLSANRETGVIQVIPKEGPSSESTVNLVGALKDAQDTIQAETNATTHVTGQTAIQIDVSQTLVDAMPLYLTVVVGLSLILLLLVFRSIPVPLLATGGFLLSLFATLGAVVAIYQNGFLADVFQVSSPGPILSFLPTMVVGILFGLAMDYQMFLVSGIREAYVHGKPARQAVLTGFDHGARVVTVAALIMVSVFAGFIFSDQAMMRPMGFGLAFGVFIDAFVIRLTLTPALLHILGDRAWWIPRWLDRILPDVDVEGARLEEQRSAARQGER